MDNDSLTKNNDIEDEHYSTMNEDNMSQLESVLKTTSLASKLELWLHLSLSSKDSCQINLTHEIQRVLNNVTHKEAINP